MYQISAESDNFDLLDQICARKGISDRKRKNRTCACVRDRYLLC